MSDLTNEGSATQGVVVGMDIESCQAKSDAGVEAAVETATAEVAGAEVAEVAEAAAAEIPAAAAAAAPDAEVVVAEVTATPSDAGMEVESDNPEVAFKALWTKFNSEFEKSEEMVYYLVSSNWLNSWKEQIGFDGKEPSDQSASLVNANSDLLVSTQLPENYFKAEFLPAGEGLEFILKENLNENTDYVIVNQSIVDFLKSQFTSIIFITIPRRAYRTPSGSKAIQIYYKQIDVLIVNHNTLKSIDQRQLTKLSSKRMQVFTYQTQAQFKLSIVPIVQKNQLNVTTGVMYNNSIAAADSIRLWKFGSDLNLEKLFTAIQKATQTFNSFDYRFKSPVSYIERTDESTFHEIIGYEADPENLDSPTLVIEVQKNNKSWFWKLEGGAQEEMCEFCRRYDVLTVSCGCKSVKYCSESCKVKDSNYHSRNCDFYEPMSMVPSSVRGLCGLSNLGNTCFMNSALQCLSHSLALSEYFIDNRYLQEINETNPLGTKGDLVKAYAKFINAVWAGTSSVFSPSSLKFAVAKVQSMFSGYQQHDSQEFLSYLLDAIHEDVNRVKHKQNTESVDSNGRPDSIVARESWLNHLKRNQSVVVDLMQGQFKSKVQCPDCNKQSITFDPFLTCSIPIPITEIKKFTAYLVFHNNEKLPLQISYTYDLNDKPKLIDFKKYVGEHTEVDPEFISLYWLTNDGFKEEYKDNKDLETIREQMKDEREIAVLIQNPIKSASASADHEEVVVKFSTLDEYGIYEKKYKKKSFTFVRPLYLLKSSTSKQIHESIFDYIKPVLKEKLSPDSNFMVDSQTMNNEDLLQKYVLSKDSKAAPYRLYLDKSPDPVKTYYYSYVNDSLDNLVELNLEDETTVEELKSIAKTKRVKIDVIINQKDDIGSGCSALHSLGKTQDSAMPVIPDVPVSIVDCFNHFQKTEILGEDNEWYCPDCKSHKRAKKEMKIYRAPEMLIIHLKRFKGTGMYKSKLGKLVDFPLLGLDMQHFVEDHELPNEYLKQSTQENETPAAAEVAKQMVEEAAEVEQETTQTKGAPTKQKGPLLYDLYAVTNHFGSLGGGHYTAYAKNNNKWHCFDDSHVSSATQDQVVSTASYILFYKRRETPKVVVAPTEAMVDE